MREFRKKMHKNKHFEATDIMDGDAKINVAYLYEMKLVEMIDKADEAYKMGEFCLMNVEIEALYDRIIDKIPIDDAKKHEDAQKNSSMLRNRIMLLKSQEGKVKDRYSDTDVKNIQQEIQELNTELVELTKDWKRELIKIMSKSNMLVAEHKGIGSAIGNI